MQLGVHTTHVVIELECQTVFSIAPPADLIPPQFLGGGDGTRRLSVRGRLDSLGPRGYLEAVNTWFSVLFLPVRLIAAMEATRAVKVLPQYSRYSILEPDGS